MSTSDGHDVIQNRNVLHNSCTSDHIPMCIEVSLELVPLVGGTPIHKCKKISWGQFSDNCINGYAKATKNNLENVNLSRCYYL